MKIKDQIVLNKHLFEVDTAHDWSTYIPDQNLSRLKETLNNSQVKKMLNRRSAFMGSIRLWRLFINIWLSFKIVKLSIKLS